MPLLLVGRPLELLHERLDLRVHLDRARDLALVLAGGVLELGRVDRDPDEALQPPQQRQRALRVRHDRDVVRNGRPQRCARHPGLLARLVQDADDPGRALVGRGIEGEPVDQRVVGGERGDADGARVGDVGQQRAERHDELDAERLGELDHGRAERAPAVGRLRPGEDHQIARRARDARLEDLDVGPLDRALAPAREPDGRPRRLEVDELLRVDQREALGAEGGAEEAQRGRGGLTRVVPALECTDESRSAKPVRAAVPAQGRRHSAPR